MPSPLFNQLNPMPQNNIIQQFMEFRKNFIGDPKQMVQNMLNTGKISQTQLNQYANQANQIYNQLKGIR
jgi:hypothetical protein